MAPRNLSTPLPTQARTTHAARLWGRMLGGGETTLRNWTDDRRVEAVLVLNEADRVKLGADVSSNRFCGIHCAVVPALPCSIVSFGLWSYDVDYDFLSRIARTWHDVGIEPVARDDGKDEDPPIKRGRKRVSRETENPAEGVQ